MKKEKLICDTNVFYRFSNKGMIDELAQYDLYVTNLTITEVISSNMLKNNFDEIKYFFNSLNKYSFKVLTQNIIQQILIENKIEFLATGLEQENTKRLMKDFLNAKTDKDLTFDYIGLINQRKSETTKWAETIRIVINNIDSVTNLKKIVEVYLVRITSEYCQKHNIKIDFSKISFNKFDYLISVFSIYLNDLYNKPEKKVKPNDYVDFMNLIYCIDDFKYLTLETKNGGVAGMISKSPLKDKYGLANEILIKQILNSK